MRDFLCIGEDEVDIKTSQFNGTQKLLLRTEMIEFDVYQTEGVPGALLFNGAVAGDEHEICALVEEVYHLLKQHGFQPRLEAYDDERKCIAEFNA